MSNTKFNTNLQNELISAWQNAESEMTFTQFIEEIKILLRNNGAGRGGSNVSWKKQFTDMFTGKGMGWLYFKPSSSVWKIIQDKVDDYEQKEKDLNTTKWKFQIKEAGYCWLRYDTVKGNKDNPLVRFEIRIVDTRKYDKDHTIYLNEQQILEGEQLGKSPLRLGFTNEGKKSKTKINANKVSKSDSRVWKENFKVGTTIKSERGNIIITGKIKNEQV